MSKKCAKNPTKVIKIVGKIRQIRLYLSRTKGPYDPILFGKCPRLGKPNTLSICPFCPFTLLTIRFEVNRKKENYKGKKQVKKFYYLIKTVVACDK